MLLGESAIDELSKQGKLASGTGGVVARAGLGIAIRKGMPKPDFSTTESFKRSLLAAQSICVEAGARCTHSESYRR